MTAQEPLFFAKARRANRLVVDGQSEGEDAMDCLVSGADTVSRGSKARPGCLHCKLQRQIAALVFILVVET